MLKTGQKVRWAVNQMVYTIESILLYNKCSDAEYYTAILSGLSQEVYVEDLTPVSGLEAMQVGDVVFYKYDNGRYEQDSQFSVSEVGTNGFWDMTGKYRTYALAEKNGWKLKDKEERKLEIDSTCGKMNVDEKEVEVKKELTIIDKLHAIEENKRVYSISYRNAGVGFLFFDSDFELTDKWRDNLTIERYYKTFEDAVNAEYKRLVK